MKFSVPTLVHGVIGLDRQAATDVLNELYGNPSSESIDSYLGIIEGLRCLVFRNFIAGEIWVDRQVTRTCKMKLYRKSSNDYQKIMASRGSHVLE